MPSPSHKTDADRRLRLWLALLAVCVTLLQAMAALHAYSHLSYAGQHYDLLAPGDQDSDACLLCVAIAGIGASACGKAAQPNPLPPATAGRLPAQAALPAWEGDPYQARAPPLLLA